MWRIEEPVDMVDFGCGFGYIGILLMLLLPRGSTYTGIDRSEALLAEAKSILGNSTYDKKFIPFDLREYSSRQEYDMAISNVFCVIYPDRKPSWER